MGSPHTSPSYYMWEKEIKMSKETKKTYYEINREIILDRAKKRYLEKHDSLLEYSNNRYQLIKLTFPLCEICGKQLGTKNGKRCIKHSIKIRNVFLLRGKESVNYKTPEDRIQPLYDQIRNSNTYKEWRTQIFGRDNFTCQECGVRGTWLEAHHKKRFSDIIKDNNIRTLEDALFSNELWDLDNGITLCKTCHAGTKGRR